MKPKDIATAATEKNVQHRAIESGRLDLHRAQQKGFADYVQRLCDLLARNEEFRGAEIKEGVSATLRNWADNRACFNRFPFQITLWIVKDNTILRSFCINHMHGSVCEVAVETQHYPHRGCNADLGKTSVKVSRTSRIASVAARLIEATELQTFDA